MTNYFSEKSLLKAPTERAAFSDRQAYVCAELSRLAYFKFEGGHTLEEVLLIAKEIIDDDMKFLSLEVQLRNIFAGSDAGAITSENAFKKILNSADFKQVQTFSEKGTQAFLCTRVSKLLDNPKKTVAYLVFRGTELKDLPDIKANINARLEKVIIDDETVELHSGYVAALNRIIEAVTLALSNTTHQQLIITGHSLGGALAIIYTRRYATGVNGACYTFGAPPVGGIEVQYGLKTPVYEIINELDVVPNLPNPWLTSVTSVLIKALRLCAKSITLIERVLASGTWDDELEDYVNMMTRYRHPGYKSTLVGFGPDARLIYNMSSYDSVRLWTRMMYRHKFAEFKVLISDHLIDGYVEKLKSHALKRNS